MSPLIRAKAFVTHTGSLANFGDKEGTRSGRGGSQYLFEGDSTEKP